MEPFRVCSANFMFMKPVILSIDPGKTNMGIAAVRLERNKPKCLANSLVNAPLSNLNIGFRDHLALFISEIETWVKEFNPSALIIERYQARGLRGNTGELISVMIGALTWHYNMPTRLITAAIWKNEFHRVNGKGHLDTLYKTCRTTPHQLDAVLIGCYGLAHGLDVKLNYSVPNIIKQIESTSRTRLINRKAK